MALNRLSENLDQLSGQELGFEFDEAAVWAKLESRLENRKSNVYWWTVAASLLLVLIFAPYSLLKKDRSEALIMTSIEEVAKEAPQEIEALNADVSHKLKRHIASEIGLLESRGVSSLQLAELPIKKLSLEPIAIVKQEKKNKPVFAAKDISIIQASLEQPSIGKGRTMTIRAQWQNSTEESNVNYQALKIKLYEKNK
ncbi:hypothetical protein SAMN05421640_1864 [Ekhidna lutea]|uniref:Uncharacterized protein n=1 Tax=Ekhidna lutea TaxID=447679 RepID=A0A239IWS9_EKHLU|nr:hypothetical protein [Ekhidna lutea]SNS97842.1 hypothetical protein SAMN05421640_1864 [Ekhidna lutea]